MRKLFLGVFLLLIMCLFCFSPVYAALSTDEAVLGNNRWSVQNDGDFLPNTTATYDIGSSSSRPDVVYGTTGNFTGAFTFQTNLLANGVANGGVSVMVSDVLAVPLTYSMVYKYIGTDAEALTLADGKAGQTLNIVIQASNGGTATLTPTTKTGFTSLAFNAANDSATLFYVDDTYGWILMGLNSVTVA